MNTWNHKTSREKYKQIKYVLFDINFFFLIFLLRQGKQEKQTNGGYIKWNHQ